MTVYPTLYFGAGKGGIGNWQRRAEEIRRLYQYYMYGVMPDPAVETVGYRIDNNQMTITAEKDGRKASFPAMIQLPDREKTAMPEGGYPVIFVFGWLPQAAYANERGYAVIT